jgi:hypothetical protein
VVQLLLIVTPSRGRHARTALLTVRGERQSVVRPGEVVAKK